MKIGKRSAAPLGGLVWLSVAIMPRRSFVNYGLQRVSAEKSFPNRVESNQNLIVFNIFPLIWNQMGFRLVVPYQSENCDYNLILVWLNYIEERFCCACWESRIQCKIEHFHGTEILSLITKLGKWVVQKNFDLSTNRAMFITSINERNCIWILR